MAYPSRRIERSTPSAEWIDGICARRGILAEQLAAEARCTPSYISRLRSGERTPSRSWLELFIVRGGLTKEEALRGYELFRYIPPGYRVVRDAA